MINYPKSLNLLLIAVMLIGLLSLPGCGEKPYKDENPHGTDNSPGGVTDNTNHMAPKKITSNKLTSFSAKFFLYSESGSEAGATYLFEVKPDENGTLILSEQYTYNISCETNDMLLSEIQKIIVKHELVKLNGIDKYTNGLAPEYQPSFLSANYESCEYLYFCINNDPYADWAREIFNLLGNEFASHGNSCFPVSKATGDILLKERPEEGDLIKGKTFYAQLPKNRYGGNCEEGDYAEGRFIIWVNQVMLSESGEITARDDIAVPYIVSDVGNDENLSMLSGGCDGDKPYGDDIWEISTDENGEIIDAVFYR